jgi:hypothetical protein
MQGSEERLLLHRGLWPVILAEFSTSVFWVQTSASISVIFMVFCLSTRLAECSVNSEISHGACKLAQTSQIIKKKKKKLLFQAHVAYDTLLRKNPSRVIMC